MFPVFLHLSGRLVLVVGGGPVGRRKARAALAADALVRLVSLEPRPADLDIGIEWIQSAYSEEHLAGVCLVLAAGPDAVNQRVAADARKRGLPVNLASSPEAGDFDLPATLRLGKLLIAVGTGGAAPALAGQIRDAIKDALDPQWEAWVCLVGEMREIVLKQVPEAKRRELLEDWADERWLVRLEASGVSAVREEMLAAINAVC